MKLSLTDVHLLLSPATGNKPQDTAHYSIFLTWPNERDRTEGSASSASLLLALNSSWNREALHTTTYVSAVAFQSCLPSYAEDSRSTLPGVSPILGSCPPPQGSTGWGKELGLAPKHSPHERRGLGPLRISLPIKCFSTLGIFPWSNSLYKGK